MVRRLVVTLMQRQQVMGLRQRLVRRLVRRVGRRVGRRVRGWLLRVTLLLLHRDVVGLE